MIQIDALISQLSKLPTTDLAVFSNFYDEKCSLLTPLEDAKGRKGVLDYYQRMRKDIQFQEFKVIDHLQEGSRLCIRWEGKVIKLKKTFNIHGISYADLSPKSGLILTQVDYWNINLRSPWLNFAISKLF